MKIIHLGITHKPSDISTSGVFNRYNNPFKDPHFNTIVRSQFFAAKYILQNPQLPVVEEGYFEDERDHDVLFGIGRVTSELFPDGFPNDLKKLTKQQQKHLYRYGAVRILFDLEKISVIHKSIHRKVWESFVPKIEKKLKKKSGENIDYVNIKREREAIDCAKEAAIEHYGNLKDATVIVVYGMSHDFKPACEEQGIEHQFQDTSSLVPTSTRTLSHKKQNEKIQSLEIGQYNIVIKKRNESYYTLRLVKNERAEGFVIFRRLEDAHEISKLLKAKKIESIIKKLEEMSIRSASEIASKLKKEILLSTKEPIHRYGVFANSQSTKNTTTKVKAKKPKSNPPLPKLK